MYKRADKMAYAKITLRKEGFLFGGKEVRDPPDPFPLVQFLFYAIRTNVQVKNKKKSPCTE